MKEEVSLDIEIDTGLVSRRKVWFLNSQLVKIHHVSRSAGMVTLFNLNTEELQTTTLQEFRKKRRRAFSVLEASKLLNFHRKSLARRVDQGKIPAPTGSLLNGERKWQYMSYYSEDVIMEVRDILSKIHHGRPRMDGLITNNKTPTETELRYAMGDGIMLYIRNDDGRMVPVFSETL